MTQFNAHLNSTLLLMDRALEEIENGFVPCQRCGDQEDTKDLDFVDDLKTARQGVIQAAQSMPIQSNISSRWRTLDEFTETPNEGWCWIAYKGRVIEAYHDHKGLFRFSSFSENVYLTECITAAQAMVAPAMPTLRSE